MPVDPWRLCVAPMMDRPDYLGFMRVTDGRVSHVDHPNKYT